MSVMISYTEAITTLYNTNTFSLHESRSQPTRIQTSYPDNDRLLFRRLPRLIQHFQNITSIDLIWDIPPEAYPDFPLLTPRGGEYSRFWLELAEMPKLRFLRVALRMAPFIAWVKVPEGVRNKWVGPIGAMHAKEMNLFELRVPSSYFEIFRVEELGLYRLEVIAV
jgi:hypothetical protein